MEYRSLVAVAGLVLGGPVLGALILGCQVTPSRPQSRQPEASSAEPMPSPITAELTEEAQVQSPAVVSEPRRFVIELSEGRTALAYLPAGRGPFPVLVAAHGAGGRAEAHLQYWARLLDERYVIFSIVGSPLAVGRPDRGYYFENHLLLEEEVLMLMDYVKADDELVHKMSGPPFAYAGYSQGATMGALFLLEQGQLFDRLILIEGGTEGFTFARAKGFAQSGGKQITWFCGTNGCSASAERAKSVCERAGLSVSVEFARNGGHTYLGLVGERIESRLKDILPVGAF